MSRAASELLAVERKLESSRGVIDRAWLEVARLRQQAEDLGRAGLHGLPTPLAVAAVDVMVYGTIPGDPTAPLGANGMPQLPGITVDVYVHATGEHVGSGTTDDSGLLSIGCLVPLALTTFSGGNYHFAADVTATPPASTAARYVGPVTVTNVITGNVVSPPSTAIQLLPATGFEFWLWGVGTPLKSGFTITDSVVGAVNVTQAGAFTGTLSYNFAGVVGSACAPAAGVPVTYALRPTSSSLSWGPFGAIEVSYPTTPPSQCPQASGTSAESRTFPASGPPYFTAAPFSAVFAASNGTGVPAGTTFTLYPSSGATITVTET